MRSILLKLAFLATLVVALGGAVPARAQQPAGPIVIAIFAPNAPFEGADARYSYVQRLATHIGSVKWYSVTMGMSLFLRTAAIMAR